MLTSVTLWLPSASPGEVSDSPLDSLTLVALQLTSNSNSSDPPPGADLAISIVPSGLLVKVQTQASPSARVMAVGWAVTLPLTHSAPSSAQPAGRLTSLMV